VEFKQQNRSHIHSFALMSYHLNLHMNCSNGSLLHAIGLFLTDALYFTLSNTLTTCIEKLWLYYMYGR